MRDCNSGIRVKFVEEGGIPGIWPETSQKSSQMFPNERLTP